jgi:hypothetical protein
MLSRHWYVAAAIVGLACATPSGGPAGLRHDANVITADEIAQSRASTAFEAVSRLRPAYLRTRGRTTINTSGTPYATVYLDGQHYGNLNSLKNINAAQIAMIRYYNAVEATSRFGLDHGGGAIEVLTH